MNRRIFNSDLILASILLLALGGFCESNTIEMPKTIRSLYAPENYQSPCGQLMCLNGGICKPNPYNNNVPTCMCKSPYHGSSCEKVSNAPLNTPSKISPSKNSPFQQSNNLCRVFNERNMNICQNGGQCVFVDSGKVACLCPTTHKGLFCELPVYLPCNGDPSKTCHRDHATCAVDGSCICAEGYTGQRCDKVEACKTDYCLNGATCEESNEEPFRNCSCLPNYYGRRCEIFGIKLDNGTIIRYNRACNLSLTFLNEGFYGATQEIDYDVFGEKQPTIKGESRWGNPFKATVPFYAENVVVRLLANGKTIKAVDRSLVSDLPCQKCYKTWGSLFDPQWDYINC